MRRVATSRRAATRCVLVCVVAVLATGCHVTVEAGIDVRRDGSGVVRAGVGFDGEAIAHVGDLGSQLRVDDLRQAGWDIVGPRLEGDGLTWVRASRRFGDPDEGSALITQLTGPNGIFRDFEIKRSRTLLHSRTEVKGVVDVSDGLRSLTDPELFDRAGPSVDIGIEALRRQFGDKLPEVLDVQFEADLPGARHVRWNVEPGERLEVEAAGRVDNGDILAVAGVAAGVLGGVVVLWLLNRRQTRS